MVGDDNGGRRVSEYGGDWLAIVAKRKPGVSLAP